MKSLITYFFIIASFFGLQSFVYAGTGKTVNQGTQVTLNYASANVTSCTGGGIQVPYGYASMPVSPGGSGSKDFIAQSTGGTFTLECTGNGQTVSDSAVLTINPCTITLNDFSPNKITRGQTSSISFSSTGAQSCAGGASDIWAGDLGGTFNTGVNVPSSITNSVGTKTQTITCYTGTNLTGNSCTSATRTLTVNDCVSPQVWNGTACVTPPAIGSFDAVDAPTCKVSGWAYDPKSPSTSIDVHVYRDGASGVGTIVTACTANTSRSDVNSYYNITGNHGFDCALPASYAGTGAHNLYIHAIDTGGAGPNNVISASPKSLTCSALSLPDLIAGGITPTSATAGTAQSYTSTITNSGNAASGAGFTVRFRKATDTLGTGATNVGTGSVGSSVASGGGTAVATLSNYNISSSAGTYYLSACADETNGGDGVINESSDGNNCGPWTDITVTTNSCTATLDDFSPNSVLVGQQPTISFSSVGAQSCSGDLGSIWVGDLGGTGGNNFPIPALAVAAAGTKTQKITCYTGLNLSGNSCTSVLRTLTISPPASNCSAQSVSWGAGNACTGTTALINHGSTGSVTDASTPNTGSATYACSNGTLTLQSGSSCTVPPTVTLTASPISITSGNSSTLTWVVSGGATSCSIDQGVGVVSASGGSQSVSPIANTTYTITCSNTGGSANASASVAVGAAPWPDLVASSISPNTATVGITTTLSSTITNQGNASTANGFGGFMNFIQISTGAGGTGTLTDKTAVGMTDLAAGAQGVTQQSHTFLSAGTYYARACADKTFRLSTPPGDVDENTNEGNNCGNWIPITVTAPTANCPAQSVTWGTRCSATTANINHGSTGFVEDLLSPDTGSATYACNNGTLTLQSGSICVFTPTVTLTASPASITSGNSSTLTWTASNAVSCSINQSIGSVSATGGTRSVSPTTTTIYTLTCNNGGEVATASATVTVQAGLPDLVAQTISPITATVGIPFTPVSNMTNQGTGPASIPFPNYYQIKAGAGGTGSVVYTSPSTNMNYLAAGLSGGRSLTSYTFSSVGTYSIMVCTDKASPADTGVITESNEGNNCSNWATINVIPPLPDLQTFGIDLVGDTLGQPTTVTFSIYNTGPLDTGVGFSALLQFSADYGTTWQDASVTSVSAIPAGGSAESLTLSYTLPSAGFYVLRVCADKASEADLGSITELSEINNCSNMLLVDVLTVPAPDLTAGKVTPTNATAGVAKTFTATITNQGDATTGASFPYFFQIASQAGGAGTITGTTPYSTMSTLAVGASAVATVSYTFASSGTYSMRVCADKQNAGHAGNITESDENNNCGLWEDVSVVANCPIQSVSWGSGNACSGTTALINHGSTGSVTDNTTPNTGSATFACTNGTLTLQSGSTCTLPPTVTLSASPTSITSGNSSTLTWTVSGNTTSCTMTQDVGTNIGTVATTGGTRSVSPAATTNYTITCTGTGGSASANIVVTVTAPIVPDLTSSKITPTSATAGVAKTFTATITNQGDATTGASFPYFFQIASQAGGAGTITGTTPYSTMNTLTVGASAVATVSHTFASSGTYSMRVCADKQNNGHAGNITESDENNNCGLWEDISVIGDCPAGQTITWGTGNACTATTGFIGHGSTGAINDSTLPGIGSATMSCSNGTLTIQPGATCAVPPTVSLTANPNSIASGGTSNLSWTVSDADTCLIDQGIGNVSAITGTHSLPVTPTVTTTYTLTCSNTGGASTASAVVSVTPTPNLVISVQVGPQDAYAETASTFTATIANVGNAGTGVSFPYFFQVASQAGGNGIVTDLPSSTMGALSAGGQDVASVTHTFNSYGTYSMRACADKVDRNTTTSNDNVNESNEGDNCGEWKDVAVPQPTGTLSVDSPTCVVDVGLNSCSIRVSWATQYAQNPIVRNESTTPVSVISSGVQNEPAGILTPVFVDEIQPTPTTFSLKQGSILLDEKTVTAHCKFGGYDTWGGTCVNPRVTLLTVHGEYYAPQGSLNITCSDSDKYKVTRRLANGTEVSVDSGPYSGPSVSVPVSVTGDYSVYCGKGSYYQDPPVVQRYNASPPPSPQITLTATPSTLTRDSDSIISWTITHPRPGCALKAETVCQNNTCNQNQIEHQNRINQTIENALVESASRNMLVPISTITMSNLPYVKNSFYFNNASWAARASWVEADWSVYAKKTFESFAYSTNFTITCPRTQNDDGSWSATSTKTVRVMVTSSGER